MSNGWQTIEQVATPPRYTSESFKSDKEALQAAWMYAQQNGLQTLQNMSPTPSMLGVVGTRSVNAFSPKLDDLKQNDIVIFKNKDGGLTAHEVLALKPGYVYTKGTMNAQGDGWIPMEKLRGRVVKNFKW